jgi:hypothetical protein
MSFLTLDRTSSDMHAGTSHGGKRQWPRGVRACARARCNRSRFSSTWRFTRSLRPEYVLSMSGAYSILIFFRCHSRVETSRARFRGQRSQAAFPSPPLPSWSPSADSGWSTQPPPAPGTAGGGSAVSARVDHFSDGSCSRNEERTFNIPFASRIAHRSYRFGTSTQLMLFLQTG